MGNAEEAFNHHKKVFGTEFSTPPLLMKDMPPREGAPPLSEADKNKITHVALPILGGMYGVLPHDEFRVYRGTCKDRFGIR